MLIWSAPTCPRFSPPSRSHTQKKRSYSALKVHDQSQPKSADKSAHSKKILFFNQSFCCLCLIDRLSRLRRHVILIMLCEHLISIKDAVRPDVTLRNTSPAFFE